MPPAAIAGPLTAAMTQAGLAPAAVVMTTCKYRSSARGRVSVEAHVQPDGTVDLVTVRQAPDALIRECVKAALSRARFPQTQLGGSFNYSFVL